jgi:sodium-dependent dicarboxylate transporter 2/3/5
MKNLSLKQKIGLLLGIIGFIIPQLMDIPGLSDAGQLALGILITAAVFWMTEPVPIFSTSILIIFLQSLLLSKQGLLNWADGSFDAPSYSVYMATLASPIIILFLGGFMLADGAVKFDLDKNLTRILLKPFGSKPAIILLGLMIVTAILSAFMSNTATTAMMMTVVLPILAKTKTGDPFKIALLLCIPFAANIGGIATPIGTPPNAVVIGALTKSGIDVSFTYWMALSLPFVIAMLAVTWVLLLSMFKPTTDSIAMDLEGSFKKSPSAYIMYAVFILTIGLWVTESLHGLSSSLVALVPVAGLTLTGVLSKADVRKLPWEVLWLVAGGLALGIVMKSTGLAEWLISLINWTILPGTVLLAVFAICGIVISNFISNTVTATLLTPIAISLVTSGAVAGIDMLILGLVVAISASSAMMLPISTPPNAIAMSTGLLKTGDMVKAGALVGLISIVFLMLLATLYWPIIH